MERKYTRLKKANKKIEQDMKLIVKEIRARIPRVLSVILTGGFSRGEGPVKEINGKFFPYNDYDIQVIGKDKLGKDEADKISIEISKKLGYQGIDNFYPFKKEEQKLDGNFYIDMKYDTRDDLKKLLPRIRTYELRNDSRILFGEDLRKLIPDYDLKKIPLSESAKLLLDRMSQMIEYYSSEGKHEKECLNYFIQQAYAACCTALLQLSGKYEIGYEKAMKILRGSYEKDFPELYEKAPELHKKIEEFINWKSNPVKLPNENVEEEWFIARKNIIEVAKYFFGKFLNRKIESIDELSSAILGMRDEFYLPYLNSMIKNKIRFSVGKISILLLPVVSLLFKYKYYQRLKKFGIKKSSVFLNRSPDLVIFGALPFFIGAISEKGVDNEMLKKGQRLLNNVYPSSADNWEDISLEYANAYIAFFLQKI